MLCPHWSASNTRELTQRTPLGYRTFSCSAGRRQFNERTHTPDKYLECPTDTVLLVVFWRLRDTLSLRDLAEMFLERGFTFTHEAVRDWEARFAPLRTEHLRTKRKGQVGRSWHVDEPYITVGGVWEYRYRATLRDGNLVDSRLSEHRAMDAAKRLFTTAVDVAEHAPACVTTDGHDAYPRAIRETVGARVTHRCNRYVNNRIEQDHRGMKQRYDPLRGFRNFDAAARVWRAAGAQRQSFRVQVHNQSSAAAVTGATTGIRRSISGVHDRLASRLTPTPPTPDRVLTLFHMPLPTEC